jgi:hypothetical protein
MIDKENMVIRHRKPTFKQQMHVLTMNKVFWIGLFSGMIIMFIYNVIFNLE